MDALLYKRRMEMLRLVYMGENPTSVMDSLASVDGGSGQRVVDSKLRNALRSDWGKRVNWIPEIVRASSRDVATFQAELLGVAREVRKRAFDMAIDKVNVRPRERVMALSTILNSAKLEMDILKYVTPTPESVTTTVETAEDRREALSLILRGLEGADPQLAFNVAKVLSDCDLASLPKLADMK